LEGAPALVPSFIGAFVSICALVALWAWMPQIQPEVYARPVNGSEAEDNPGFLKVLCTWPVPLLVVLRSTQGFLNFAFFEVVPLWAISSLDLGGLALSENILGTIFAFSAVGSGGFMAIGIKRVTKSVGLRRASALGNLVCLIAFVIMPFVPNAVVLMIVHAITNSAMGMMGACYIASINNAVHPSQRATVNGICVTFESFGKGIGPMLTAIAFASSLSKWGVSGHGVVFFFMSFLHLLLIIGTVMFPSDVEGLRSAASEKARRSPLPGPAPSFVGVSTRAMRAKATVAAAAIAAAADVEDKAAASEASERDGSEREVVKKPRQGPKVPRALPLPKVGGRREKTEEELREKASLMEGSPERKQPQADSPVAAAVTEKQPLAR